MWYNYICYTFCRDTIFSPNSKLLKYKPNEPNTINLQRVGERAGLLANEIMASKDLRYEQAQKLIKFDEIIVRGDALLFNSLLLKVHATIILFIFSFFLSFSDPPLYVEFFTLYSFLLDHLDCTLLHHLNLYLSICLVKHLLWFSVNSGG